MVQPLRRKRPILAIAWACLIIGALPASGAAAPAASKLAASKPAPGKPAAAVKATDKSPTTEQEYIAIVDRARRAFGSSKSVEARAELRIGLQISIHEFMGQTHMAQGWLGTFMGSNKAQNGSRSIRIEIAPGIAISTWDSPYVDAAYDTMAAPGTPVARAVEDLTIGEPVMFSADLLGSVIGDDEEMVMHPRIIAAITRLTSADDDQSRP